MIGILGAGISGLSLGHFLESDYEILEKEQKVGGLCRTYENQGFLYDVGGHVLFSHDKATLGLLVGFLGENVHVKRRNSKVWYRDRFVKYPFENGLHALDREEVFECLRDYLHNDHPAPDNLEQWFYHCFGTSISDKYMLPYNRKIWKTDPAKMGLEFVARIPKPPLEDILKSAIGIETEGYVHQLDFFYPKFGGIESVARGIEGKVLPVSKGEEVREISRSGGQWVVRTSRMTRSYSELVSTLPIFELLRILRGEVPEEVRTAVERLRFTSLIVVSIGTSKVRVPGLTSVYVPDPESPAHRYCFSDGFSEHLAPGSGTAISAEISVDPAMSSQALSDSAAVERTLAWLVEKRFIDSDAVVSTNVLRVKYAYPVYDLGYSSNVRTVREYFDSTGLHLLGRFSRFVYDNIDACVAQARDLAGKLKRLR